MPELSPWILATGVLLFVLVLTLLRRPRMQLERGMPGQLRDAKIVLQEESVRSPALGLVAKPDRVYQVGEELVVVELKTRLQPRVYESDRIELSVQRAVLEAERRAPVSRRGWVLTHDPRNGKRTALPVELMDRDQIFALRDRYHALLAGRTAPMPARSVRQCEQCAYLQQCQQDFGDRYVAPSRGSLK